MQTHAHHGAAGAGARDGLRRDEHDQDEPRAQDPAGRGHRQEARDPGHEQDIDPAGEEALHGRGGDGHGYWHSHSIEW